MAGVGIYNKSEKGWGMRFGFGLLARLTLVLAAGRGVWAQGGGAGTILDEKALIPMLKSAEGRESIRVAVQKACDAANTPQQQTACATLLRDITTAQDGSEPVLAAFASGLVEPRLAQLRQWVPDSEILASMLNNLAYELQTLRQTEKPLALYKESLVLTERLFGPVHLDVAHVLRNLGRMHMDMGRSAEGKPLFERALKIRRTLAGESNHHTLESINDLALVLDDLGDFEAAEPLFKTFSDAQRALGESPDTARSLNVMAGHYMKTSRYEKAEPLLREALEMRRRLLPPKHPDIATTLNNLATLYSIMARYDKAVEMFREALEIRIAVLGPEDPATATLMNNFGGVYRRKGEPKLAEPLFKDALTIRRKKLGSRHPLTASTIHNLANTYLSLGRPDEAEPLYLEGTAIIEALLPEGHPDRSRAQNNLAGFYTGKGEFAKAEELYNKAIAGTKRNPTVIAPSVDILMGFGQMYAAQKRFAEAAAWYRQALNLRTAFIGTTLPNLAEQAQREFIRNLNAERESLITHSTRSDSEAATRQLGIDVNLLFKGLGLNMQQELGSRLRREGGAEAEKYLSAMQALSQRITAMEALPGVKDKVAALRAEREEGEQKLLRLAGYREWKQTVSVADVQRNLPAAGAFLDLAYYRERDPKNVPLRTDGPWRYAAFLYLPDRVEVIDLGLAAPIHAILNRILAMESRIWKDGRLQSDAVILRDLEQVKRASSELFAKILEPVQARLGVPGFAKIQHWLISPDGELGYLPWEMLVDGKGRYLMETAMFSYVESPRALVHGNREAPANAALALLDPQYDLAMKQPPDRRGINLAGTEVARPLFQGDLARQFSTTHPGARLMSWDRATEQALTEFRRPASLLIWTHGKVFEKAQDPLDKIRVLLRGASAGGTGADSQNGYLTARKVMDLDLTGTRLAVVAGCNTGYGTVEAGEGLLGMRRALWVAGSRSQLLTLWPVSDLHTVRWLEQFYQEVRKPGVSEVEAVVAIQRRFAKGLVSGLGAAQRHPYFWASFTLSGGWQK